MNFPIEVKVNCSVNKFIVKEDKFIVELNAKPRITKLILN